MLLRIVQFVLGALLAGGGGYLAWTHRAGAMNVFPPGAEGMPWLVIAGVLGLSAGVTLLVSAVHPRPNRKARLAAEAAHRDETLGAADAYYSERSRAADRDWRSGDIPAPVRQAQPTQPPAPEPVRAPPPAPPPPPPPAVAAPPPPSPQTAAPPPPPTVKPVATSAPPSAPEATPFPSVATLAPIPKAAEPPPAPIASKPAIPPVEQTAAAAGADNAPFQDIRAAIAAGRLDEAEKMLNTERERTQGVALAELTGLAGDHAAAAGRTSHAKWLWRRSLSRFGELNAMDTPAARAVAEKLRTAE